MSLSWVGGWGGGRGGDELDTQDVLRHIKTKER